MEPITMAIIAGVASASINAYAAYKKGEISEEEYRKAVQAANDLERELRALRPDETWENINPKLLSEAAKFSPEVSAFVEENAPQLIQEAGSATEKRVQREALQKLATQAETGRDVISEAQREQALYEAGARAKSRQEQLAEALRRKGQLGTGQARSLQFEAEQAEALAARQDALRGVQDAEMRRRQALGQAATMAGQIRSQNLQVESANVGTMNAYNQRLANARNLYNQYASGERNRAQMINQQRQRETEQYNLGLENQYAMFNRQQQEAAKERARQFDVDLKNRMFDLRRGADTDRSRARMQQIGDYGTAVTSGIGTGMSAYGLGLSAERNDILRNMGTSTAADTAQGLSSAATQQAVGQPSNFVEQQSQTGSLVRGLYPFKEPVDTTPGYRGPLRPEEPMPVPQSYDWRDQSVALNELGNEDWRVMQARARRNK